MMWNVLNRMKKWIKKFSNFYFSCYREKFIETCTKMTITRKINIGKIWNLIFLSIQPISDLSNNCFIIFSVLFSTFHIIHKNWIKTEGRGGGVWISFVGIGPNSFIRQFYATVLLNSFVQPINAAKSVTQQFYSAVLFCSLTRQFYATVLFNW